IKLITHLPNDLEAEILSRAPAKSLSELKTPLGENIQRSKVRGEEQEDGNLRVSSIAGDLHGLYNNSVEPSIMVTGKLGSLKGSKDLDLLSYISL
ncbi:unnamed protein product, partial [Brassica oleracea]